jgi:hypothetical protein
MYVQGHDFEGENKKGEVEGWEKEREEEGGTELIKGRVGGEKRKGVETIVDAKFNALQ